MSIVCFFKGHIWKRDSMRLMVLDDSYPPNYVSKSNLCGRCGKQKDIKELS